MPNGVGLCDEAANLWSSSPRVDIAASDANGLHAASQIAVPAADYRPSEGQLRDRPRRRRDDADRHPGPRRVSGSGMSDKLETVDPAYIGRLVAAFEATTSALSERVASAKKRADRAEIRADQAETRADRTERALAGERGRADDVGRPRRCSARPPPWNARATCRCSRCATGSGHGGGTHRPGRAGQGVGRVGQARRRRPVPTSNGPDWTICRCSLRPGRRWWTRPWRFDRPMTPTPGAWQMGSAQAGVARRMRGKIPSSG